MSYARRYRLRDYDQAIADYDQAIHLNPNYALAYYYRGYAYEKIGNTKQTIYDYKKALALDDNSQITRLARENLERLQQQQGLGSSLKRWFF